LLNLICRAKNKQEELMPWQTTKLLKSRVDQNQSIPDPSESSVHGKEVHVAKQQQTQKEVSIRNLKFTSVIKCSLIFFLYYFYSGTRQ
jgi:hypothetical protein